MKIKLIADYHNKKNEKKENAEKLEKVYDEVFQPIKSSWGILGSCDWYGYNNRINAEQKSEIEILHNSIDELRKEIDKLHTYLKVAPPTTKEKQYLKKITTRAKQCKK